MESFLPALIPHTGTKSQDALRLSEILQEFDKYVFHAYEWISSKNNRDSEILELNYKISLTVNSTKIELIIVTPTETCFT